MMVPADPQYIVRRPRGVATHRLRTADIDDLVVAGSNTQNQIVSLGKDYYYYYFCY